MRFPRNTKIFRGQLDPAPYASVFFLLVIFVMLNSSWIFTPGVPIRMPEAADLPGVSNRVTVVVVDDSGQLYYRNQVTDEAGLKRQLQAVVADDSEPLTLVIQADQATQYAVLVRLSLLAREAGIREVLFATRPRVVPTMMAPEAPPRT